MARYRQQGRRVILVGDLNVVHRPIDTHWNCRKVLMDKVLSSAKNGEEVPQWKLDLKNNWTKVIRRLKETRKVIEQTTTNPATGERHDKFRLV